LLLHAGQVPGPHRLAKETANEVRAR
jgi:hypothetical protein